MALLCACFAIYAKAIDSFCRFDRTDQSIKLTPPKLKGCAMTTRETYPAWPDPLAPAELNRLHDEARRLAPELRREALADFWRGADAALATTLGSAQRSASRLAQRLARHRRDRTAPTVEA